jgi:hypothetical protein
MHLNYWPENPSPLYILGMKAYHGNPYDGYTIEKSITQMERISGFKANDITLTVNIVGITIQERH